MVTSDQIGGTRNQLVLGIQGETQGSMIFVCGKQPCKNETFFGWNQITKSRGVSADWMVCGVELRDVDS